jgi:hypothetical protein
MGNAAAGLDTTAAVLVVSYVARGCRAVIAAVGVICLFAGLWFA